MEQSHALMEYKPLGFLQSDEPASDSTPNNSNEQTESVDKKANKNHMTNFAIMVSLIVILVIFAYTTGFGLSFAKQYEKDKLNLLNK